VVLPNGQIPQRTFPVNCRRDVIGLWPNNWKFTGRVGLQWFGGAQLFSLASIAPFTEPVVRFDLDRMDDNDNRLFGVTAEIMWLAKPAYQLTLRTPLYFVRN
jgi:hypothetical protein